MSNELECPNCGKINPLDISNCIGCNLSVSVFEVIAKKKKKQPIICSNCGHENPSLLSVCEECGEKIKRKTKRIEEKKKKRIDKNTAGIAHHWCNFTTSTSNSRFYTVFSNQWDYWNF